MWINRFLVHKLYFLILAILSYRRLPCATIWGRLLLLRGRQWHWRQMNLLSRSSNFIAVTILASRIDSCILMVAIVLHPVSSRCQCLWKVLVICRHPDHVSYVSWIVSVAHDITLSAVHNVAILPWKVWSSHHSCPIPWTYNIIGQRPLKTELFVLFLLVFSRLKRSDRACILTLASVSCGLLRFCQRNLPVCFLLLHLLLFL